jgi:hypothetical protein
MARAGESIQQLAQRRRNKALLRFGSAGGLAIAPFIIAPLIGTAGLKVLVFAVCLGSAFALARGGLRLWRQAKNAERGARAEETVALSLEELQTEGWQIEYNIPVPIWGDVDAFLCSPTGNCFAIDTKSHGGTVFFDGTKLMRRYGQQIYEFENNKDLLKAARGQAVEIKKMKGVRYVTLTICFTKAELDIRTVDNFIERVYVVKHESLVRLLRRLDSR